jgi:integrase
MGDPITAAAKYPAATTNKWASTAPTASPRTPRRNPLKPAASSQPVGQRVPVFGGKQRISGLYSYLAADGTVSYPWSRRVDGNMRRGVLETTGRVGQERKTEAVNEYRALFVDVQRGTVKIGDRNLTVTALVDNFIGRERGPLGTRAARTVDTYETRLRLHVLPVIGSMKADDVRVRHIRDLLDRYKTAGQAGASVRNTIAALAATYRHGVIHLGVGRNPVRELERNELPSGKRQTEPRYLTLAEVEKLLAKLSDETRPVASVCFYAAARVSEALALRWEHLDFDAATIYVPGTKTKASDATVRLLPALARELRAHRSRQAVLGFDRVKPAALVFQTKSGQNPHRRNILRAVKSAAERAGLVGDGQEPVGVHDLRHSLAGQAFALSLSPVEVSKMLRHANPQVTMTVYAGMADGAALAAGDKLAAAFGS